MNTKTSSKSSCHGEALEPWQLEKCILREPQDDIFQLPALFIGRFQPFHLGHLDALRQILEHEKSVLIGIGSAYDSFLPENPFTAGERYEMIRSALKENKLTEKIVGIIPISDIRDNALWVSHVRRLCPPFGNVYTSSPIVKRLFKESAQYNVYGLKLRKKISGTSVRTDVIEGKTWKNLIPSSVADLLIKWDAVSRLKEISK